MKRLFSAVLGLAAMVGIGAVEARAAALEANVSLSSQTMTVRTSGRVAYRWPVSTARPGYVTPRGSWRPVRTHRMWYSRKYDMSPMPYSVFFRGGYAVHGTNYVRSLGRPASHGCVRLQIANAATFYGLVKQYGMKNTKISITD